MMEEGFPERATLKKIDTDIENLVYLDDVTSNARKQAFSPLFTYHSFIVFVCIFIKRNAALYC